MGPHTSECQRFQQWMLDVACAGHEAEIERHVAGCAGCAAVRQEVRAAGGLLSAVAESLENQFSTSLSPQLRERVRVESQARLARKRAAGEGSEAPSATFPGGTNPPVAAAKHKRRGMTPMQWAAAALLLLALGGLAVYGTLSVQDFARLNFADGKVKIARGGAETTYTGLQKHARLAGGTALETEAESRALFTVGRAYVAMAPESRVVVEGPDSVRVARGEIWLQVNPSKSGFWVHTEHGAVHVTGTFFGVTAGAGLTHVQVTEGAVVVSSAEEKIEVGEGQEVRADGEGVSAPTPRAGGETRPVWIDQLNEKSARADDVQFLPTIAGEGN